MAVSITVFPNDCGGVGWRFLLLSLGQWKVKIWN